jgi:hypothetical protein
VIEQHHVVGEERDEDRDHRKRAVAPLPEHPRPHAHEAELYRDEREGVALQQPVDQKIVLAGQAVAHPDEREDRVEQVQHEHGLHDPVQPMEVLGGADR